MGKVAKDDCCFFLFFILRKTFLIQKCTYFTHKAGDILKNVYNKSLIIQSSYRH